MNETTMNSSSHRLATILIMISTFGFLITTIANSLIIIQPLGNLFIEYETGQILSTSYILYSSIKIYGYIAILGYFLLGIGLFGFFLKFHNPLLFLSCIFSFIAVLFRAYWILNFCPDWSVIGSGFKVEMLDIFEFNLGLSAAIEFLTILLFSFTISIIHDIPRSIRIISAICTIIPIAPFFQLVGMLISLQTSQTFLGIGLFSILPFASWTIAFATFLGFFFSIRIASLDLYIITGLSENIDTKRKKILKVYSTFLILWIFSILYVNAPTPFIFTFFFFHLWYYTGIYNIGLSIIGIIALSIFIFYWRKNEYD